ncbi:hypothetical protein B0J13DRAFT_55887 [Dactylonectria estremocensis]|uniref:Amidohydrolase-related domain-containing protein n=1 Tax=Dactylonectria estremocensis TaxID=1079267 RepID=A0A9P9J416_9HYPO|nr:hypothetical protein B0J13DRAFT_55887 [Dactylonectria estremocensis]
MTIQRATTSQLAMRQGGGNATAMPEKAVKSWKLPPQKTYLFQNANVVDAASGSIVANMTVKISGGLIEYVGRDVAASPDDVVIDLDGKYICPGLIDCHVHISAVPGDDGLNGSAFGTDAAVSHFRQPYLCGQMLVKGFTTIRDTGGATLALKEAIEDDVFPGPRMFIANQALSQTGGHGDRRGAHDQQQCCGNRGGLSTVVDGVPECIRAARDQLRTGADFIKIMVGGGVASPTDRIENTQFTAAEIRAICEVAESYGTYVTAHAYTPKAIRHAVDHGVRGIEHGNLLDRDTALYLQHRGVWLTPTLITYAAMGSDKYAGFLPPANLDKNRLMLDRGLDALRVASEAGLAVCHGSDLLGPLQAEQSREFGIRARVLSGKAVLQGATVNAAKMLRQEAFLGSIKEGFAADMLILNANPLDDVSILDEPEMCVLAVIKNGRVYMSRWSRLPEDLKEERELIE